MRSEVFEQVSKQKELVRAPALELILGEAQKNAERHGHPTVRTLHTLGPIIGCEALDHLWWRVDQGLRTELYNEATERVVKIPRSPSLGKPPLAPLVVSCLDRAKVIALQERSSFIFPDHLLHAYAENPDSAPSRFFQEEGIDLQRLLRGEAQPEIPFEAEDPMLAAALRGKLKDAIEIAKARGHMYVHPIHVLIAFLSEGAELDHLFFRSPREKREVLAGANSYLERSWMSELRKRRSPLYSPGLKKHLDELKRQKEDGKISQANIGELLELFVSRSERQIIEVFFKLGIEPSKFVAGVA